MGEPELEVGFSVFSGSPIIGGWGDIERKHTMTTDIRPFREDDRTAIIENHNQHRPAHHQGTLAEWERNDALRSPDEVSLRLCAGEPAWGYLEAVDRSTTGRRRPGVCSFTLWIDPEQWSEELADALFDRAVEFAHSREAKRLTTYLTLHDPADPLVPFLARHGFTEIDRIAPVMLDLAHFDPARFASPAPDGITFFSYAEAGDTDENRRKLYALDETLDRDVPTNDAHSEPPPFEEWQKRFDRPEHDGDALLLAANGAGEWIGISQLGFQEQTNIGWTFLTGVLPEYRGQGIALALKLRALDAALARGCPLILTENHEDNAPMRAINKKLGFAADAPGVSYGKDI